MSNTMRDILNAWQSVSLLILFTTLCLVYGYFKHCYNYWNRRNVPYIPGVFPFGNITSVILRKQTFTEMMETVYHETKRKGYKYMGMYLFTRKALLVIDPELVKKVLSTDFQYFPDRGIYYDEKNDPLSAHLVALSGKRWKELRQKLSPTFSSGKLKGMFETVLKCGEQLTAVLESADKEHPIEMKDLAARYTIDVIGSCAFGIECNSLTNTDAEFRRIGKMAFQSNFPDGIKRFLIRNAPMLARILKIRIINKKVSEFFIRVVTETIAYRKKENISRNDFLQLLMELMDKRDVDNKRQKETKKLNATIKDEDSPPLTVTEVAAHSFVFFLAGFETSASTITFALFELTSHTNVQQRLRQEVFSVLKKHNNIISYEAIMDMKYMDQVLLETMRKYPTFVILMRKCTRDYNLQDGSITLEKGIPVIIPVHALHHDHDFHVDPQQFNPNRFVNDQPLSSIDYTYLPFGNGPRICIGLRFAMIQMKVAITVLLRNYKFTLNEKTKVPLIMNPSSLILSPLGGTWINVLPLSSNETLVNA